MISATAAAMSLFHRRLVAAASGLVVLAGIATASATPDTGVSSTVLGTGTSPDGVVVSSRDQTQVTVAEITIAPGGSTGWHYHTGQLIAVVKSGTLTRTVHDCSTEVTTAGASLVEPAGREHVHIGRNLGAEPVVLLVTYVVPAGQPLSLDAPAPACAQ